MKVLIDISEDSYKATCNECMLPPDVENVVQAIKNSIPLDSDLERAEVQAYFDGEAYGWEQGRKALVNDLKAEIEDCSFDYYFEYGEYIGENPIQHRICMTDKVLEILSKAKSEEN
jgi:hypothetical protein